MMVLNGAKDRISKFLLGESGSVSKKKIVGIGLISFVASAASLNHAGAMDLDLSEDTFCYKTASDGASILRVEGHASGDIDNVDSAHTRAVNLDMRTLLAHPLVFDNYLDMFAYGYGPDSLAGEDELFECGEVKDHLSFGAGLSNHYSDNTDEINLPEFFLHRNSVGVELDGDSLVGSHTHAATNIGGNPVECQVADHLDNCCGHNSNHLSGC